MTSPCSTSSKEEVQKWIDSPEYRELNFKREALVINPTKACQPLGAIFAANGFAGTLPYVHGSQGCVAYFRNSLSRHYREPVSAVADSMTEDAAVFGGNGNLTEGLRNCIALYKPKMVAVSTTCMAEVIGDDLHAFISKARETGEVSKEQLVTFAHTPSFVGSHITGYDMMLKNILTQLLGEVETHGKKRKTNTVNIITGFDPHVANVGEVRRLLKMMDVETFVISDNSATLDSPQTGEYNMYPGGTSLDELPAAPFNAATIALQKFSTLQTIKALQEKWRDHESFFMYPPMGIQGTDEFLMNISRVTGKPISAALEAERGRVVDAATDAHQYFHGKKFAIFGDPDEVYGMTRFILEMGGEPIHIMTATGTKQFKKEMDNLITSSPFGAGATLYVGKDLWHMRSLVMTEPVDMLLGDSHGKYVARDAKIPHVRFGYPIFDRVNLHRYPIIGYQGALNLITWIANAFIEDVDLKSDDGHFELLR